MFLAFIAVPHIVMVEDFEFLKLLEAVLNGDGLLLLNLLVIFQLFHFLIAR
jgi:hypothetical protein